MSDRRTAPLFARFVILLLLWPILGFSATVPATSDGNNFQVVLETPPETIAHAYLIYELTGVPHWTAAVRSINGLPSAGGFGAIPSEGTELQVEEINPRWLHAGSNQILFSPARRPDALPTDAGIPYTVRNLRLAYEEGTPEAPPRLTIAWPLKGESDAAGTVVRGFVDPAGLPSGPAELFVNETYFPQAINPADGSFSVFVPHTEGGEVAVEVVYPDGSRLRKSVSIAAKTDDDTPDAELDADAGTEKSLALGEARLDVTSGAVNGKVKLTMRGLRRDQLPALDGGMTNVTPNGGGFRMGPHGLRFRKPVHLRLPYDPALLPKGMTADDVRTYFFDEQAGRWFPLQRVPPAEAAAAKTSANTIVSATNHFTDFINATLTLPDEPAGANYSPNSLKELAKADPASQIVQIAPPEGGATGDALLDFPIVVPQGRQAMQPELSVHYDSSGGNGWLGVGWDLRTSSIEISTLFGVPRYDGSEKYVIDGEQLAATTSAGVFVRRAEGSFERIVRLGSGPTDYSWEVTDKDGTRRLYGQSARARLRDPLTGNTFRWYLEREIDLHGNTVDYSYVTDQGGGGSDGERWTEVYPAHIDYTGVQGAGAFYHVTFTLDDGSRPDRLSSGRQGFKTYTRRRLQRIDVLAGSSLVRQYVFAYREGDFHKSLLASLAVTGENGAELDRHTFDYVAMAAEGDGYDGFAAQQSWSGIGSGNDFTASSRAGGGAHGFAGLGPPECQPHGGVQLGGSSTDTTQSVSFLDVNGDGLPDRINSNGTVELNGYDPATDPDGSRAGSFRTTHFDNTDTLGHTSEWSLDFGLGFHAEAGITASLSTTWVWTHANDDHAVADVNGDLRPDLVSTDGGFAVRVNDGHSFTTRSDWSGFGAQGLNLSSAGEESQVLSSFPLSNPLRQLIVPYDGHVTLGGTIQKKENTGDGVDVAIYHNGTSIWSRRFAGSDTAACAPGPGNSCSGGLGRDVKAGDSLYFLAGSVRDTSADALLWAPVVSYDGKDAQAREPYGAPTFVFNAGDDFQLAGYQGAAWSAPAAGTAQITGSLIKQETSDDAVVTIVKKRPGLEQTVFTRSLKAAEVATVDGFPAVDVAAGDLLFLRVSSRTPIDPRRIQWTPTVTLQSATELPDNVRTQHAAVALAVPRLLPLNDPTRSFTPSSTGNQKFSVSCTASSSGTLYVQGINRLLMTQAVSEKFDVTVSATAGEPLFFTLLGSGSCSVNSGAVPVNVRWPAGEKPPSVLSGGHHGWFYGDWNGNAAFNAGALVPPASKDEKIDYAAAVPHWDGTKGFVRPAWTGSGFDMYMAAEGVKPSRKGSNAAGVIDQASGATSGGGLDVLRKTSSRTVGFDASAGASLSYSSGNSDTQLDLVDMNGDRYPDQVSGSGVRFSNGANGFGSLQSFPGLGSDVRSSADVNITTSAGLGITYSKKSGDGKATAVLNTLPASVGNTVSLTQTSTDLIDVNGDGLPDRVTMSPNTDSVTVQLNLGYRFGAAERWSLPAFSTSGHCTDAVDYISSGLGSLSSLDKLNGLSFTRSSAVTAGVAIGPFGASTSTTMARTLVELVDVNGDGLPDRVSKDQNDDFFRVQLNLGDRWDGEQRWYVPRWSTTIGKGYNPGLFQCLDAVTFSGHIEVVGSAGAPVCIPLIPPTPIVGLQIEISAQGFGSVKDGAQLFFEDVDGDGLADHVLKRDGDSNVYVKRNQAGKVNLLKTVHRPLGSSIDLSYERRGNHADNPFSQWVLSAVSVADGRDAPYVTRYQYGNDSFYDRNERENYGYGHVRVTLPDGSAIDRDYQNRDLYSRHLKTKEVLADAVGNLFRVETSRYEEQPVAGSSASRFPALVAETTSFYEGTTTAQANAPKSTGRTYEYDGLGNVIRTTDSADSGIEDDVTAAVSYRIDPDTRLTRPATIDVRDGNGRLLRSRQGTYNAAGDLVQLQETLIGGRDPETGSPYSGAKNAVWTRTYDELGNVASSTDPTGYTSTITYESTARTYPSEVRDSFGYVTGYTYDLKHGELLETTDENGSTVRRTYDAFGRLVRVVGPYDSDSAPALSFEYGLGAPISFAVVHHKDSTRTDPIDSSVFIDSLERVLQTKEDAELDLGSGTSTRSGMRVSGRVDFDAKGRIASQGQPTFDDRAANQFVDVAVKNPTTFTYDMLDRVRTVRFPYGAATQVDYGLGSLAGVTRLAMTRTDPNGHATRFYRDVKGNVLAVEQTNTVGGARKTLLTRYTYDALDELTAVADAKGNTTRLEYDTLGHNVTLDNPDRGRTEYRYDPAGNLGARISPNLAARNQQIRYLYTFGRLDRIDYPLSPDVVYTYGPPNAPANRANRIATVTDSSGTEERSYGKLGEVVQLVKTAAALNGTTPKGPYVTRFQFDDFSRLLSVIYPDGETLTYGYDAGGQVKSATGLLKGVRFDYLRHRGYDEFGDPARMVAGNGVETRSTHDAASRFLTQLRTTGAGRDLQNLRYRYDLTGTLLSLQNDVPVPNPSLYGGPVTQTFQYDDLMQLTGATGTYSSGPNKVSTYTLGMVYDEIGNTLSKNQLHQTGSGNKLNVEKKTSYNDAFSYGGPQPHAATHIGDRAFAYDADGNQIGWTSDTSGTRRTLTWDEEDRLASVADNGQTTRFLYDAEGTRTNKAGPNGETIYVNRWFTVRNGAIASKHVFADNMRVATKVSPDPTPPSEKVYFFQADHLGSTQFVTDELGTVYQHLEYFPSGEIWVDERSETQRTPYLFSGKELDDETGLSYFGYRYYDARPGQWLSADPILDGMLRAGGLTDSNLSARPFRLPGQMYAYVGNDPLNLFDPDGRMPKGQGKAGVGGRHGDTKKNSEKGLVESNHFPASASYKGTPYAKRKRDDMPAVTMKFTAHRKAASTGSSKAAVKFREQETDLLQKGQYADAMKLGVDDMFTKTDPLDQPDLKKGVVEAVKFAETEGLVTPAESAALVVHTNSK